ncbi:MAG: hypothetical protein GEU73_17885 [Chloroflexi bacterium]|nr:hypothetical protein [Chloroflexota bacterium]
MSRQELINDSRFLDNPARVEHREEINGIVAEWIACHTRQEVAEIFDPRGIPYSLVFDMELVFQNAQYLAREMLVRVLDSQLGQAVVQNVVPKFSKTPGGVKHLGPRPGEHNEEIYCGLLGYSKDRLQELQDAGVI